MAALRTKSVHEGQKGQKGQSLNCPSLGAGSGAGEKGQKGHTPLRGVPDVPESHLAASGAVFSFVDEDEAFEFLERAAIREYDGNLPRAAAERLAWLDVLKARAAADQTQPTAKAS